MQFTSIINCMQEEGAMITKAGIHTVAVRLRAAVHVPKTGLEKTKGTSGRMRHTLTNRARATVAYFPDGRSGPFSAHSLILTFF
jgi:hypothetical protein